MSTLTDELASFKTVWRGGYCEGDPLDPLGESSYGKLNYMSVLHATYLRCIKPYITPDTVALEIGPGRGAWTKALLPSREVWALDALSAEHNRFYEYLGHPKHVTYTQVKDFSCAVLPDNHFTYMFSFGCLCHVSFEGISEYARNLYPKLKPGANCFWMVADYSKFNHAIEQPVVNIWRRLRVARRYQFMGWLMRLLETNDKLSPQADNGSGPIPGRWYDAGSRRTCEMLREVGYKIVDEDVGTLHRDPIIHFVR